MTTAVIGATGRVGSEIVRGLLARGQAITALVRDPGKARRAFGDPGGLHIRPRSLMTRATSPTNLTGSATCSSRWDQSGSRASCNGSRSTPPPGIPSIEQVTRPLGAQHLDGLTGDQPASPLQHRPVRLLDRSAVLDDPARDLLGVAARRRKRGARNAHLDRPRRQRPHGLDRPSRRGRRRSARAHRPGTMGRAPRPHGKEGAPWMIGGDSRSRFRPEQGFWSSERRVEVACASAAGLWTARWAPCPAIVGTADACSSGQGWPRLRAGASG